MTIQGIMIISHENWNIYKWFNGHISELKIEWITLPSNVNSNSIFPTSSIMIDLIINLYETNISLRVSFLLPLELCWGNGAKVVLKSHLKNLQLPEILKGNTRVEAVWHPRGTDKRTDVWSRPSCIYTQIFSPKNNWFFPHKKILPKISLTFFTFILCNCAEATIFYKF